MAKPTWLRRTKRYAARPFLMAMVAACFPLLLPGQVDDKRFSLEAEGGALFTTRNDVRQPNNEDRPSELGTRFSLLPVTGRGPFGVYRVIGTVAFNNRHSIRAVYAPVDVRGTGRLDTTVRFAGAQYAPGQPTRGIYQFNSYRLGYRYDLYDGDRWRVQIGATAFVRDAKIQLRQGSLASEDTDVGFVPLAAFSVRYTPVRSLHFLFDAEGLAGGPGRAVDAIFKTNYDLSENFWIGAGYRVLEGGADVDQVFAFAFLHYAVATVGVRF